MHVQNKFANLEFLNETIDGMHGENGKSGIYCTSIYCIYNAKVNAQDCIATMNAANWVRNAQMPLGSNPRSFRHDWVTECRLDNGQWTMDNGQWTMDNASVV